MAVTRSKRKAELDGTTARPHKQVRAKSKRTAAAFQAPRVQSFDADAVAGTLTNDDDGNEADDEHAEAEVDVEADSDVEDGEQLPHKQDKPQTIEERSREVIEDKEPESDDTTSSRSVHNGRGNPLYRRFRHWSVKDKKRAKDGQITDYYRKEEVSLIYRGRNITDWSDVHDEWKDGKYERHSKWYIRDHLPWLDPGKQNQIPNPTKWQKLGRKHGHAVENPRRYRKGQVVSSSSGKRLRSDLALEFADDEIEEILEWHMDDHYERDLSDSEKWFKSDNTDYKGARLDEPFLKNPVYMDYLEEEADDSDWDEPKSHESQEHLFDSDDFGQNDFRPYGAKTLRALAIAKVVEDIDEEDVAILEERGLEVIVKDIINNILERSERSILGNRTDNQWFWAWRGITEQNFIPWIEAKPQNVARLKGQSLAVRQGPYGWFRRFFQLNTSYWQTTRAPTFQDRNNFCWFGDKQGVSTSKARLPSAFQVEGVDMAELANFPSKLMLYRIWTLFGIHWKETANDGFRSAKFWRVGLRVRGTSQSKLIVQGPLPEGDVTCIFWGHRKDKGIAVELLKFSMDKDGCLIGQRVPGREFGVAPYTADDGVYEDMYRPAS